MERAGGAVEEMPLEDGVERREVARVVEKAGDLHHVGERAAGGLEHVAEVRDHLLGLRDDAARHHLAADGRDLPRDKDEIAGTNRAGEGRRWPPACGSATS